MKSILVFLRILIVGCLWGIVFTEGIRVIMLCNWHFDIFWPDHWHQFATTWRAGWFPRAPKEWAFILLMVVFFPMLITGWWTLCMVAWEEIIWDILKLPYTLYKKFTQGSTLASITSGSNRYGVVKRKSYKLIRPTGINTLRVPISDYGSSATSAPIIPSATAGSSYAAPYSAPAQAAPVPKKKTDVAATIDHALFKFDDDDDDDFDLDIDSFEKADIGKKKSVAESKPRRRAPIDDDEEEFTKPEKSKAKYDFDDDDDDIEDDEEEEKFEKPRSARRENRENRRTSRRSEETSSRRESRSSRNAEERESDSGRRGKTAENKSVDAPHGPVYDALAQKNYEIISNISVKDTFIDFVGVSESDIFVCLIDKESGDWLADEEMFNGEEPLWFSENSHRVSPVCKLNNVKKQIGDALDEGGFDQKVTFCVIIQMANIINADDMFDIWNDMGIEVTRINRGAPKEIKLFSKCLTEADGKVSKKEIDGIAKLLKNIK